MKFIAASFVLSSVFVAQAYAQAEANVATMNLSTEAPKAPKGRALQGKGGSKSDDDDSKGKGGSKSDDDDSKGKGRFIRALQGKGGSDDDSKGKGGSKSDDDDDDSKGKGGSKFSF